MVIIVLSVLNLKAQNNELTIKFDTLVINYGKIYEGSNGKRVFNFENISNIPASITGSKTCCGGTMKEWDPNVVYLKGDKGKIEIEYDTHRIGYFHKTYEVIFNKGKKYELIITGEILPKKVE